jgi:hypothetical protein
LRIQPLLRRQETALPAQVVLQLKLTSPAGTNVEVAVAATPGASKSFYELDASALKW